MSNRTIKNNNRQLKIYEKKLTVLQQQIQKIAENTSITSAL
jgi:hypothetical protein